MYNVHPESMANRKQAEHFRTNDCPSSEHHLCAQKYLAVHYSLFQFQISPAGHFEPAALNMPSILCE